MPTVRVPLRAPFQPGGDQATMNSAAVGFMRGTEDLGFPAMPFVVLAGATSISDPILGAGFNGFMCVLDYAGGGGTTTFHAIVLDPLTQAVAVARTISAAVAPGAAVVITFGVGASLAGDVPFLFQFRLTANVANQTYNALRFWMTTR